MKRAGSSTYRAKFGAFDADFATQVLRKHNTRVRLRGKAFALLKILVDRSGEIVTRDEMKRQLWPEQTFVDFENGLNAAIRKLRGALGDAPENPRYVQTIPKTGYRFIAPVEMLEAGQVLAAQVPAETTTSGADVSEGMAAPRSSSKTWKWLVAAAVIGAIVTGGVWIAFMR